MSNSDVLHYIDRKRAENSSQTERKKKKKKAVFLWLAEYVAKVMWLNNK